MKPVALHSAREALEELWEKGVSGHELLRRLTALADAFIQDRFNASEPVRQARGRIALVALGGYGRGELFPYSDIDLLLLHDRGAAVSMQAVAESILYPLWDCGYEVGHSVRTPGDAVRFARDDFIFRVSLLDARFLAGSRELYDKLRDRFRKKVLDGGRKQFVEMMERFRDERREKFGSHSYLLEPHIKEGKGGMRDIQAMLWVGKAVFGLSGLQEMEEAGVLDRDDRRAFEVSWNRLVQIRNRLHYISNRKNDQLFFEYQEEMTAAFGYRDSEGMLGVEHFMREVYGHLQTVAVVTDLFFEHVREVVGFPGVRDSEKRLEKDIAARDGSIRFTGSREDLAKRPHVLMRLFLQSARTGLPLHYRTRRIVAGHLDLVDDRFRSSKRVAKIFVDLLMEAGDPMPVLETMLETGLLTAYLPEFAAVESLAQHDLYHIFTVDRHQLQTVAEIAGLRQEEEELFSSLHRPHLLCLAALLHDIGKGQNMDHSELGAETAGELGRRIGLDDREREELRFLVRHHLFLPENAMRRDLEDLEFIRQSAELIGSTERLTMLYLLTVADSRATGPSAWSSWKASLIADFYLRVKSCLEASCTLDKVAGDFDGEETRGVNWLRAQVEDIVEEEEVRRRIADLPDDYMLCFTPSVIAEHLRIHREKAAVLQQKVLVFPEDRQGYWSILVMSRDRTGLLAKLCGTLALHNLRVLGAHIFTWPDGTVVDVLNVLPVSGIDFDEQDWAGLETDMNLALNYRLDVGTRLRKKVFADEMRTKRQVQQLRQEVIIDNTTSQRFTVIEVYGEDAPGTLHQLTQTLADFGLDIHRARIATEVEQLIDIFYVSLRDGRKLEEEPLTTRVREALMHCIVREESLAA
ncbi:MAG: [protein-PII] uridylyltransferase [Desulfobulbaceae bacterium]